MAELKKEYHGSEISFDEKSEEWVVYFDGKEQRHKSIQVIKNYIDRRNKKAFDRVSIFIEKDRWNSRGEEDYVKAEITSVGVDGTIFVVEKGGKHASHLYGRAYEWTDQNRTIIYGRIKKRISRKRDIFR